MHRLLHLLKKYDTPGPRYTSYPTVPAWTQLVGPQDYQTSLQSIGHQEPLSLYFHLPYCENLCHFCGCTQVITKDHARSKIYTEHLLREIRLVRGFLPPSIGPVTQCHFGGGTPNFFQPEEMTQLMNEVRQNFTLTASAEIAIEMHPNTSSARFNKNLRDLGFNRISLGIQDFDTLVQKLINRHQSYEVTKAMVQELRELGFSSFNFDLVYGLPGQSLQGWEKTLTQVAELNPSRLAVYSYAHVPWVRPVQRTFREEDLPTPETKLLHFESAYRFFIESGYQLIGMDHFAKADDELFLALQQGSLHRNFMGYSTRAEAHQIGFGMSAISHVGGNYFQNHKKQDDYFRALTQDNLATLRGKISTQDDRLRRDLIGQLMCAGIIDEVRLERDWSINFDQYFPDVHGALKNFVDDNLLIFAERVWRVQKEGFIFLRNIAMPFDAYLNEVRSKASTPVFSRTI